MMRPAIVWTVLSKEFTELLRDRRTLISMVVLPIVVFPAIFAISGKVMKSVESRSREEATTLAVPRFALAPDLEASLRKAGFTLQPVDNVRKAVEDKTTAAGLEISPTSVTYYVDRTRQASDFAGEKVRGALAELKDQRVRAALRNRDVPESVLNPFVFQRVNVASERKMGGFFLGSMLGYVVILLMFSGGMYPAIDMTAGEKERRTIEAYLASPAHRSEIVLGKLLTAVLAIFATALVSLGSMIYSLRFSRMVPDSMRKVIGEMPMDAGSIGLIVLTLVPVAVMAGSLIITIALFARSFKEAQSYLTPLILVVIFPALIGGLPGFELTPTLAVVPILNSSQLMKGILLGDYSMHAFWITQLANLAYAAVSFFLAVRFFNDEKVLFRT